MRTTRGVRTVHNANHTLDTPEPDQLRDGLEGFKTRNTVR